MHKSSLSLLPLIAVLLLVALSVALGGCRQAKCVWTDTKEAVATTISPCCPDPCGYVLTDPIYSGGCGGGTGDPAPTYGAFHRW